MRPVVGSTTTDYPNRFYSPPRRRAARAPPPRTSWHGDTLVATIRAAATIRDGMLGWRAEFATAEGRGNESAVGGWAGIGRWLPSGRSDGPNGSLQEGSRCIQRRC